MPRPQGPTICEYCDHEEALHGPACGGRCYRLGDPDGPWSEGCSCPSFQRPAPISPAFEKLARERSELQWDVYYCERYHKGGVDSAREKLTQWERAHAEEWNASKPWFEKRLTTSAEMREGVERMRERCSEKQLP